MKFSFIVMTCGYAGSSMVSNLIYERIGFKEGFSSYKEAITNLALDFYAKYYDECLSIYENRYDRSVQDCCRRILNENKKANFCSTCGNQLVDKEFDYEKFAQYIMSMHEANTDNYGEAECTGTRELNWWPFYSFQELITSCKNDEVIFIMENAEQVLLAALLEGKPELKKDGWENHFSCHDWEQFKNNIQPGYR
jgi:hypothetical protein